MRHFLLAVGIFCAVFVDGIAFAGPVVRGQQVIGVTNSLRCYEHNGARHVVRDGAGRVHMIWIDGVDVRYVRGEQGFDGVVSLGVSERVNDDATPPRMTLLVGLPTARGAGLAVHEGAGGTEVHVAWTVDGGRIYYRCLRETAGFWSWDAIVYTGIDSGLMPAVEVDSTGRIHVVVERSYSGSSSCMRYATSADGVGWVASTIEYVGATGSSNYRFPAMVVDGQDRVHLIVQAAGYLNDGPNYNASWWAPRYWILEDGVWVGQPNPLGAYSEWGPPPAYRAVLFAYPNLAIDGQNNLHLTWHGTARSGVFAKDDTFYVASYYDDQTDSWGSWTDLTTLHARDHRVGGDVSNPIVWGGVDGNLTWVPSLADDPATGDIYIMLMFGLFDDEIGPSSTSVATEAGLVWREGGVWDLGLMNLTNTPGGRNWYPNVGAHVYLHANGRRYLDMLWIDGVHNPADIYEKNYDVIYSVLDLGPAMLGDMDGDGDVDLVDADRFLCGWSGAGVATLIPSSDLDNDADCDVDDWAIMAGRFTGPR